MSRWLACFGASASMAVAGCSASIDPDQSGWFACYDDGGCQKGWVCENRGDGNRCYEPDPYGPDQKGDPCIDFPCPSGTECYSRGDMAFCDTPCFQRNDCSGTIQWPDEQPSEVLTNRHDCSIYPCACVQAVYYDEVPTDRGVCRPECSASLSCEGTYSTHRCVDVTSVGDSWSNNVCSQDPCELFCNVSSGWCNSSGCCARSNLTGDLFWGTGQAVCIPTCMNKEDCDAEVAAWPDSGGGFELADCGTGGCTCLDNPPDLAGLSNVMGGFCRPTCDSTAHDCPNSGTCRPEMTYPRDTEWADVCVHDPCSAADCRDGDRCVSMGSDALCEPTCHTDSDCAGEQFDVWTPWGSPQRLDCNTYSCACVRDVVHQFSDSGICRPTCGGDTACPGPYSPGLGGCIEVDTWDSTGTSRAVCVNPCLSAPCTNRCLPVTPDTSYSNDEHYICYDGCSRTSDCNGMTSYLTDEVGRVAAADCWLGDGCVCADVGNMDGPRCIPACTPDDFASQADDSCAGTFGPYQCMPAPVQFEGSTLEDRFPALACVDDPCATMACNTDERCELGPYGPYCAQTCTTGATCDGYTIWLPTDTGGTTSVTCASESCVCVEPKDGIGICRPACVATADTCQTTLGLQGNQCLSMLDTGSLWVDACTLSHQPDCGCSAGEYCFEGYCREGCQTDEDCQGMTVSAGNTAVSCNTVPCYCTEASAAGHSYEGLCRADAADAGVSCPAYMADRSAWFYGSDTTKAYSVCLQ